MTKKNPTRYYFILLSFLIFSIFFWIFFLTKVVDILFTYSGSEINPTSESEYWERDYLPEQVAKVIPIDKSKIIFDSSNHRRIVSNLVNIAVKNSPNSIAKFANDFKNQYPSKDYKIIYIDSVVNRLQVELPVNERLNFMSKVKSKLNQYRLLVWDESLFDYVKAFNDPNLSNADLNWYLKVIHIDKAWEQSTGNKATTIAIIDNGFDLNHPELLNKSVKAYNVIDKSTDVHPGKLNHGTHVSSTIVANGNNDNGLVGICPDCSFMPIKVEDENGLMSNTYIIDAILYAIKNGADVINLSLGMQIPSGIQLPLQEQKDFITSNAKDEEEFWNDLFDYANEKNVTCVLAAGNSNIMTGVDPFQRTITTIKVGAVDNNLNKASFSNFGENTTIYAPGTNISGAKPGGGNEVLDGTSMAAPIIAGLVGLIKSNNRNLTNEQVLQVLNKNTITKNNLKIVNINASLN